MIVIELIRRNQIILGMLIALCLFVPWEKRRSLFWLRAIATVVISVGITLVSPVPLPFDLLVSFLLTVLAVPFCFDCGIKHVLFAATCAYCVQHITSKVTYLLLVLWMQVDYTFVFPNMELLSLGLLVVANILVCIPTYFLGTRRMLEGRELKFDSLKLIIYTGAFIIVAVFLSYYAEEALDVSSANYYVGYTSLNALCALFAFLVMLMNFINCRGESLAEAKRTLEQLLKKDKEQYEIAKQNAERINIRYHDIKQQHNMGMDAEESAKLDSEIDSLHTLYYTGNKAVDITLSEKAARCAEAGIQFVCSVDGSCLDMLKPYHIFSLLGNAVDNAVESLSGVSEEDKKVIRLDICRKSDMAVIRVENYVKNAPALIGGLPVTTKSDRENHGYGIKSMKNIAEEYGGTLYIQTAQHEFTLIVMIPITSEEKSDL